MIAPSIVEQARDHTKYLVERANAPGDQHRAVSYHVALEQGRDAVADEHRLWIAFEQANATPEAQTLFDLRWARFQAAHPEAVAA